MNGLKKYKNKEKNIKKNLKNSENKEIYWRSFKEENNKKKSKLETEDEDLKHLINLDLSRTY